MPSRFDISLTSIEGITVIQRKRFADTRGSFERLFCSQELLDAGIRSPILQINRSQTKFKGSVRGMHYQKSPHAELKFVSCLKGAIYDVGVDLRYGSSTFLSWHAVTLSAENNRSMIIPEGCAHGFQTLTEDCELLYLHTAAYNPECEGAVNALDPRLKIEWPIPITEMSDRDKKHPLINNNFLGLRL